MKSEISLSTKNCYFVRKMFLVKQWNNELHRVIPKSFHQMYAPIVNHKNKTSTFLSLISACIIPLGKWCNNKVIFQKRSFKNIHFLKFSKPLRFLLEILLKKLQIMSISKIIWNSKSLSISGLVCIKLVSGSLLVKRRIWRTLDHRFIKCLAFKARTTIFLPGSSNNGPTFFPYPRVILPRLMLTFLRALSPHPMSPSFSLYARPASSNPLQVGYQNKCSACPY